MLRKAAVEFAKRPNRAVSPVTTAALPVQVSSAAPLSRRSSTTSHIDLQTTRSLTVVLQQVTTRAAIAPSAVVTASMAGSRSQGNPMLASLLDPDLSIGVTSAGTDVSSSSDRPRAKRPLGNDNSSLHPPKRRPSSEDVTVSFPSPSMRQVTTTRSTTMPMSRSFSVPTQSNVPCRPSVKLEPSSVLPPSTSVPKSFPVTQLSQLPVKLDALRSPSDIKSESKPSTSQQRSNLNSELINLLSADDFDMQRNGELAGASDCNSAGGQYDGSCDRNTPIFRAPSRGSSSGGFTGSGSGANNGSGGSSSGGSVAGANVAAVGVGKPGNTDGWETATSIDGMNWETSPLVSTDEVGPRSATPKSNHVNHGNSVSSAVIIKSEVIAGDELAPASVVTANSKPPITVKLKRRVVKPNQRRGTPQSDSALDRPAWKERVKQSVKFHSSACESSPGEALDFEVDGLTSSVRGVSPVSPSRCSSSPRLPGGGMLVADQAKVGEKRPRVMSKAGRLPAEKKQRKDDSRKLSRKIYEFDDDGDVFVNSSAPVEKISTIKITKSDGRLQIQHPVRSSSVVVSSTGRSLQQVHKTSASALGGTSHSLTGQKLNRSSSLPVRPPVRPKSTASPRTDAKNFSASPVARPKQLQGIQSNSDSSGLAQLTSTAAKVVSSTSKPTQSSGSFNSGSSTKTKVSTTAGGIKKSSLNAVIDKLTKSATSGTEPSGKELYDQIRLEIIREGNKPSTPTRDLSSAKTSSTVIAKRPDTPKDASVSRPPIPIRKPVVTTSAAPVSSVNAELPPRSVVRFTAPPASPPTVAASRIFVETVSVVVPRIPRDQLTLSVDRVQPGATTGAFTPRPPQAPVRPPEHPVGNVEPGSGFRMMPGPRPPRPQNQSHGVHLQSPTFETPRYRTQDIAVVSRNAEQVPHAADPLPRPTGERLNADETADRLATRHFMDAMMNSSAAATETSTPAVTSAPLVDRRLSPPRSPSPTPVTQPVSTQNVESASTTGDGSSSAKWVTKTSQQAVSDASVDVAKPLASSGLARPRMGQELALELTVRKPSSLAAASAGGSISKPDSNVDERKSVSVDEMVEHAAAAADSFAARSPAAKRAESNSDRKTSSSSTNRNTMRSPHSPNSPDASLIIDCFPGTPVVPLPAVSVASPPQVQQQQPQQQQLPMVSAPAELAHHSPAAKTSSSSPSCVVVDVDDMRSSPSHSGDVINRELVSPVASDDCTATNGDIDDDLMNEALIL